MFVRKTILYNEGMAILSVSQKLSFTSFRHVSVWQRPSPSEVIRKPVNVINNAGHTRPPLSLITVVSRTLHFKKPPQVIPRYARICKAWLELSVDECRLFASYNISGDFSDSLLMSKGVYTSKRKWSYSILLSSSMGHFLRNICLYEKQTQHWKGLHKMPLFCFTLDSFF